jgi:cytidylate kinase
MVSQQRALGAKGGVVMEGRDIGTAVFPDAEVKIFLDASPEVRGDRRYRQVALPPDPDDDDVPTPPAAPPTAEQLAAQLKILTEMKERDARDRNRPQSPLRPATDAVILDSTKLTLDEVLEQAEQIVRSHLAAYATR